MSTKPFEITLYEKLHDFFYGHDFILMADKKQFRKFTPSGFLNVIFTATTYEGETWLEVNFGCRHEQIEQIAQQFLGNTRDYWPDANTLVISIGKFNNAKYFRYKIIEEHDLDDICEEIKEFLNTQGFVFLTENNNLNAIHHIFNDLPNKTCKYVYNQTHRCFKGMIAAKLINSDKFLEIAEKHRKYMVISGAPEDDFITYERLMSFLLYISNN
ncbi:hypothetical protein [Flectobacillus major]|uniref:hypothetical protein n=1 Tax=Flectobacillus major TaxID=103 RepID=UPI00047A4507|nr:hypothetical protein [Flectobacillus major]